MQMYFDSDRQMRSVVVRDRQADGSLYMVRVTADFNTVDILIYHINVFSHTVE